MINDRTNSRIFIIRITDLDGFYMFNETLNEFIIDSIFNDDAVDSNTDLTLILIPRCRQKEILTSFQNNFNFMNINVKKNPKH